MAPWETDISLPNLSCAKCTLQVIEFMADHPYNQPGGYSYHHCADLQISADSSKPMDKGWPTATMSNYVLLRVFRERAACLDQRVRALSGEHVAVVVHRHSFTRDALAVAIVALEGRDVCGDAILGPRADADAVMPVRMSERSRLRIDGVQQVALDEEPADAAELIARLEVLAVLIEDLEAVV